MTIARRKIAAPAAAPAPHNGFSLISNQKLLQIYSAMLQCRMIEARIRALIKQNQLDKHYDTTGQEAAFVGAAIDLLPEDTLAPYHRALIPCFLKGLPLSTLFALLAPRAYARPVAVHMPQPDFARALPRRSTRQGH